MARFSTLTPSIFFSLVVLFSIHFSGSTTLPGCEDQGYCGAVNIPFPFGTREGCYLYDGFLIRCINSSRTLLGNTSMVVREISLQGYLLASYEAVYDCYNPKKKNHRRIRSNGTNEIGQLPGTLFYNSTANVLAVIGCDVNATVKMSTSSYNSVDARRTNWVSDILVLSSSCNSTKEVEDDGSCAGIGCYQTTIPNGSWEIHIRLNRSENQTDVSDFSPCNYGFLVQRSAFVFSAENLTNIDKKSSFPVLLDWVAGNFVSCEIAKSNSTSYACKAENSTCYDLEGAVGYRCRCQDGFEGNPYLHQGCTDIVECTNSALYNCSKHSTCLNTMGSYTCTCDQGYSNRDNECIANNQQKHTHSTTFAAIGGTGIVVILAVCFCLYSRFQRRKMDKLKGKYFRKNGGFLLRQKVSEHEGSLNTVKIFNVEELQKATNDFDETRIIGRGGFGIVFKGELANKTTVAIKKATTIERNQVEQFINEVILLSQVNNRNVVKLLGCCLETEVPLLVYEFIDNGTLYQHLHNRIEDVSSLSWNIRLRIAREVAGVLSYLHSVAFPPIIHRDIKSANILLDSNYTAKVADFGISRLVLDGDNQVSTIVQGTQGYLDPEYLQTGMLTEKSDVYSFGIVLIELLTGKIVFASSRPKAQRFLSNYFLDSLHNDHLIEIFDTNTSCNEYMEQLKQVSIIAKKCISVKGEDRPSMKEVVWELEALMGQELLNIS